MHLNFWRESRLKPTNYCKLRADRYVYYIKNNTTKQERETKKIIIYYRLLTNSKSRAPALGNANK